MIDEVNKKLHKVSAYQPSQDVIDFTKIMRKDYNEGTRILTRAWTELNDRTVVQDYNRGLMMFNGHVDTSIEDPNESWKVKLTRSYARNKGIAMHAQFTSSFLIPMFEAQNENDEEDRDFSEIMRDLFEWLADPSNSNYQSSFIQVVMSMMYSPVTYLSAEFFEIYQKIKQRKENGEIVEEEVLDEVLSGFRANIYGATEVLITNAYERNMQRQRAIIQRRFVEYSDMKAKYGNHPNWVYVQEGIKSIYNDEDGLFYDVKDDDHPNLVAEEIRKDRRNDSEVPFVNGIYLGNPDVNMNPIRHRDHKGRPKYNLVPFGYARIGDHFFYFKSMMSILGWENAMYDTMSEIVMNRAILETDIPVVVSGTDEQVDSGVVFPSSVTVLENENAKVSPLLPSSNLAAGFNVLRDLEQTMNQASTNETIDGQLPDASQKAFNVATAQENSKKIIGSSARSMSESIVMFGDLVKDIIINHITVPQVENLVGGRMKMKYKTFLLNNKKTGGKLGKRQIKFDESLIGAEMTDEEKMTESLKLLEMTDYPHEAKSLKRVNPELFAKYKYLCKIDIGAMFAKGDEYMKPLLMALKQQLSQDPHIDQETLTRRLLYAFFNSEGEEFMKDEAKQLPGMPNVPQPNNPAGNQIGNQILNNQTAQAVNNVI